MVSLYFPESSKISTGSADYFQAVNQTQTVNLMDIRNRTETFSTFALIYCKLGFKQRTLMQNNMKMINQVSP